MKINNKCSVHNMLLGILFIVIPLTHIYAEDNPYIPDYYSNDELQSTRYDPLQFSSEHIDPFSGQLNLQYVDMFVPGNGGMDIKIIRSFTSNNGEFGPISPTGVGWDIHFGRVFFSSLNGLCSETFSNDTRDNPVLELPDGSKKMLFLAPTSSYLYITKDRWKADCKNFVTPQGTVLGLELWSPDGMKYELSYPADPGIGGIGQNLIATLVTKITDRNGNWITINYKNNTNGITLIDSVASSDNRDIRFSYTDENLSNVRLLNIQDFSGSNQYRQYSFIEVDGVASRFYLTGVDGPEGLHWGYEYKPPSAAPGVSTPGQYSVKRVTYPNGGYVDYTYDYESFYSSLSDLSSTVIKSKTTSDNYSWIYNYEQDTSSDTTTVTTPDGDIIYKHFGSMAAGAGTIWKVGLLLEKEIRGNTGNGLQLESYQWGSQLISNENYERPSRSLQGVDQDIYAPILLNTTINRDGTTYSTTYQDHDLYGNPWKIIENGNDSYIKDITYYTNETKWILHEPDRETIDGGYVIDRTFTADGNLDTISKYGVVTDYAYTTEGDVSSITDAEGKFISYNNYFRGIPEREDHPENIVITRNVNTDGTIDFEVNGEGHQTNYSYDGLGRVELIDRTINANTSFAYNFASNYRTLTKGTYTEREDYDDFGRLEKITRGSAADPQQIIYYDFDELGRKTFESYPPSPSQGITYTYDALGRLKSESHDGGGTVTYTYLSNNRVEIKDQNNNTTTYTYRSYGNPDEKLLIKIASPENITTDIEPNKIGQVTSISQGGKTRTFIYNAKQFLETEINPETGDTIYGRDNVGNMTSRKVGNSVATTYLYDDIHRLYSVITPDTSDYTLQYDKNNNLKVIGNRSFTYDANDNLKTETISVDGQSYTLTYGISSLDHVDSVTYPSGRVVNYQPNNLGWPTQVSPFVYSVTYYENGQPEQIFYDNGAISTMSQNSRKWLDTINISIGLDSLSLNYNYDNNGNIKDIINVNNSGFTKHMSYDNANRLKTASGIWGSGNINYDTAGNISSMQIGGLNPIIYTYDDDDTNLLMNTTGGLSKSYLYDEKGNVKSNGATNFTYDELSNLRTVRGNYVSMDFTYDGANNLIKRVENNRTTILLYSNKGNLYGEYLDNGLWLNEYAYLDGKLVAEVHNNDAEAPDLSASGVDIDGTYVISWDDPSTTSHTYELYESTTPDLASATLVYQGAETSFSVLSKPNGRFYYWVRSCASIGSPICSMFTYDEEEGDELFFSVAVAHAPDVPASISVPTDDDNGSYTISWAASTSVDVTHYNLYESTDPNFEGQDLIGQTPSSQTSLSRSNMANNTYYYRVTACYNQACSDYRTATNSLLVYKPLGTPPNSPPSITVPINNYSGQYTISWEGSTGGSTGVVAKYQLFEASNSGFSGETLIYQGSSLSFLVTGKDTGNGTYYYRVSACDYDAQCSAPTEGLNGVSVRIPPGTPGDIVTPGIDDDGNYTVSWGLASGKLTHYELYEDTQSDFSSPITYQTSALSMPITGKSDGVYYYQVRACNEQACSDFQTAMSNPVTVSIPTDIAGYITIPESDYTGSYTVSWGSVGDSFTHYELFEATDASFTDAQLVYSGTNQNATITKVADGRFYYRVRACNGSSCYGYRTGGNYMNETIVSTRAAILSIITNLLLN